MKKVFYWRFKTSTENVKGHVIVSIDDFELCTLLDIDARSTTAIICNQFNVLEKISPIYLMKFKDRDTNEPNDFVYTFAEQFGVIYKQNVIISDELLSRLNAE